MEFWDIFKHEIARLKIARLKIARLTPKKQNTEHSTFVNLEKFLKLPLVEIPKPRYYLNILCKQLDGKMFWIRKFIDLEKTIHDEQDLYNIESTLLGSFKNKNPDNHVVNMTIRDFRRVEDRDE